MKIQIKLLAFFCACSNLIFAQTFHWESPIDSVSKDGYYRILLQPDVTSKLQSAFSDVRIYDQDSIETPYLIFKDDASQGVDRFVSYEMAGTHYETGNSYITVKNSLGNSIDHIVLEVNNADAKREMTLTGSYDGEHFFAVVDHFSVTSFDNFQKGIRTTTHLLRFDFPLTDYKFYRFNFDGYGYWWGNADRPIFVVRAGYTEPTFIPEECLEIPLPKLFQIDSVKTKQSIIHISFDDSEYVDHLRFSISTRNKAGEFYRSATLFQLVETTTNGIAKRQEKFISSTILSSSNANEINLGRMRVKNLVLKISNDDNRPLIIDTVRAFQVKHYLVAFLEKKNKYCIRFGNDSLTAPIYDMKYFKDKIPAHPEIKNSGSRKDISSKLISPSTKKKTDSSSTHFGDGLFKNKRIIWFTIGLVILLLGFMTSRMLKEMKSKEGK